MSRAGLAVTLIALPLLAAPASARAQSSPDPSTSASAPAAPAPSSASAAASASATSESSATCSERIPAGRTRPVMKETIAARAVSGHAQLLTLEIQHGPAEVVLPSGFRLDPGSPEFKALEASRFFLPDPSGVAKPRIEKKQANGVATTTVKLWFVPLPEKPGRNQLQLPPLPIAISRPSGEVLTLCTRPHALAIEDPIANESDPKPKRNPDARVQREEWTAAKHAATVALIALPLGAALAVLIGIWRRRPKVAPPGPPPRPPWETAIEALFDARHSGLLAEQRWSEFYDRVSDIVRRYLGERFGYDGLESTTREAVAVLREAELPVDVWLQIQQFMQEADLVKFAKRTPTEVECLGVLDHAEAIVSRTRPAPELEQKPKPAAALEREGDAGED
jgi:hypothetical protein